MAFGRFPVKQDLKEARNVLSNLTGILNCQRASGTRASAGNDLNIPSMMVYCTDLDFSKLHGRLIA
jgi:hypothetical protein